MLKVSKIKVILEFLGGIMTYFLGDFDAVLKALLLFMFIDYATGILKAINDKTLSSKIGLKGIISKITILLVVALATSLDNVFNIETIRYLTIGFYVANEGISILENTSSIGIPYPEKLKTVLKQINDKD